MPKANRQKNFDRVEKTNKEKNKMRVKTLKSAGCGIDKKGFVYAQFTNGNFDLKNGVHISDICNEWLSALSKEDKKTIIKTYKRSFLFCLY